MAMHKAIVKHKLTKKTTTLDVSDTLLTEDEVKAHLERVIPDHEFVSVELVKVADADRNVAAVADDAVVEVSKFSDSGAAAE